MAPVIERRAWLRSLMEWVSDVGGRGGGSPALGIIKFNLPYTNTKFRNSIFKNKTLSARAQLSLYFSIQPFLLFFLNGSSFKIAYLVKVQTQMLMMSSFLQ